MLFQEKHITIIQSSGFSTKDRSFVPRWGCSMFISWNSEKTIVATIMWLFNISDGLGRLPSSENAWLYFFVFMFGCFFGQISHPHSSFYFFCYFVFNAFLFVTALGVRNYSYLNNNIILKRKLEPYLSTPKVKPTATAKVLPSPCLVRIVISHLLLHWFGDPQRPGRCAVPVSQKRKERTWSKNENW